MEIRACNCSYHVSSLYRYLFVTKGYIISVDTTHKDSKPTVTCVKVQNFNLKHVQGKIQIMQTFGIAQLQYSNKI